MVAGCADLEEVETIEKALVFDEFNVDQPRGHFAYIEKEVPALIDQHFQVTPGFVSRSSGIVQQTNCSGNPASFGSGTLTSTTRFTTALHVVNNRTEPIKILFGSSHGSNKPDGNYVSDFEELVGLDYEMGYRSKESEEEPFLAMRLFQMGLTKWAEKDNQQATDIRNYLRTWEFDYDVISPGSKFAGQGYADLNGTNVKGEDIVVLKAIGTSEIESGVDNSAFYFGSGEAKVPSGFFLIDRPGVFFDYFPTGKWEKLDIDTPLWMEHANSWPGKKGKSSSVVRLISRPGRVFSGPDSRKIKDDCGGEHSVTGLVPTTLDGIAGSSGGSVIAPNIHQRFADGGGAFLRPEMLTIGVFQGSRHQSKYDESSWQAAGPVRLFDASINTNYFTGISNNKIPSGDTPDVPITGSAPKACEKEQTGDCIPCAKHNSVGKCIETVHEPSDYPTGGNGSLPINPRDIREDDDLSAQERAGDRAVKCGFTSKGGPYSKINKIKQHEYFPGMLVGIAGGSKGMFGKEDYVSDLYAICAPVSRVSYTENWRFLYTKGSVLPWKISGLENRRSWSLLSTLTNQAYTKNNNLPPKGHTFRPIPMKMCPPKYIMDGLDFVITPQGITGVKSLHCRKPNVDDGNPVAGANELSVFLDASEQGVEDYTIFGKEYTLDQRIGNVNLTGNTAFGTDVEFRCRNNGFLSHLEMSHDKNGVLDKFHPYCTPYNL